MTKGEIRKARKEAAAAGQSWNIETANDGGKEIVRTRSAREEINHQIRMERWARQAYDRD